MLPLASYSDTAALTARGLCPKCFAKLAQAEKFCGECGYARVVETELQTINEEPLTDDVSVVGQEDRKSQPPALPDGFTKRTQLQPPAPPTRDRVSFLNTTKTGSMGRAPPVGRLRKRSSYRPPSKSTDMKFPEASPAFHFELFSAKRDLAQCLSLLDHYADELKHDFMPEKEDTFNQYQHFLRKYVRSDVLTDGELTECKDTLVKIKNLHSRLENDVNAWQFSSKKFLLQGQMYMEMLDSYNVDKAGMTKLLQKHLTKKTSKSNNGAHLPPKLWAQQNKMEMRRIDIAVGFHRTKTERELQLLEPLVIALRGYHDYFKAGMELLGPFAHKIQDLERILADGRVSMGIQIQEIQTVQDKWYKQMASNTSAGRSEKRVGGIRDTVDNEVLEKGVLKQGYLYVPGNKNFEQVWCYIDEGNFFIEKVQKLGPKVKMPLMICTVKENNKAKYPNVFSVISPRSTLQLQAVSLSEMNHWIDVLENAISLEISGDQNSKSERKHEEGKEVESVFTKQVKELGAVAGNAICADCLTPKPDWVSINLGVLICKKCSGIHRSLGTHISQIRSLTLDALDTYQMAFLKSMGNAKVNALLEAKTTFHPKSCSTEFIHDKYEHKKFLEKLESYSSQDDMDEMLYKSITTFKHVDSLRLILLGANAKHPVASEDGRAAVHGAVYYHNAVGLELIFRNSVDSLHVQEQRQWNPLHYAAYQDSVPMVKFILSRGGASLLQSEDVTNMTPLQVAKSYNAESKAAVVLEEYASTHAPKTHHRHTDSVPHEEQKNTHFLEMKSKIQMSGLLKDHRKGLKKFPLSVRGEKLVNWVISAGHAKTKYQAMALCQGIVRYCGLRPCGQPAYDKGQEPNFEFSDDRTLFQFTRQT